MNANKTITQKLNILLVENNPSDRMLISNAILDAYSDAQLKYAENMKDALTLAAVHSFNFILIESTIPDNANSIRLIRLCQSRSGMPDIILMTSKSRPQQANETFKIGVSDHLHKSDITSQSISKSFSHLLQLRKTDTHRFQAEKRLLDIEGRLKTIVGQLNAIINVELTSVQEINTTVQLPEKKNEATVINRKAAKTECNFSHLHILIAEDNDINRFIIEKMIKNWGVEMTFASNGIDTVRQFSSTKFDMVLMDIEMPGMNGYQTAKTIRDELKNTSVPIIAMTGHIRPDEKQKCIRSGMNDYIAKPFTAETMKHMIEKWQPTTHLIDKNQ